MLALLLAITAAWWTLALWPLPDATPAWLLRTRAVCFGSTESGLPDATGWLVVVGQPLSMIGALFVGWGGAVVAGVRKLSRAAGGRALLAGGTLAVLAGLAAATVRVVGAQARVSWADEDAMAPSTYPRLDRAAAALAGLVDQQGETVDLRRFAGRPLLVTFAYAHCSTLCPLLVHDVLAAQKTLSGASEHDSPAVLIVTLDPWRDTPARLPSIAASWKLGDDAYVASGAPEEVVELLRRWNVAWSRDDRTGEIVHPAVVYLVDRNGTLAYAATAHTR